MEKDTYLFEVSVEDADGNFRSFLTTGKNIVDVYYNFNDKVYNGKPIEIVEAVRKDKIVEDYSSNLELNPDYKPTDDKTIESESAPMLAPGE